MKMRILISETLFYRWIQSIPWTGHVSDEEVLRKIETKGNILKIRVRAIMNLFRFFYYMRTVMHSWDR